MSLSSQQRRLELPESLRAQMFAFRRRVWTIKLIEAGCGAAFGVLVAYLVTFLLDRVWETPADVRVGIFLAAVEHVADQARSRDFDNAVPNPKHGRRAALAVGAAVVGVALLALYPAAAANAWARFLMPWRDTPRYTFAMVEDLPDKLFVAHGEPFTMTVTLAEQTLARPSQAE